MTVKSRHCYVKVMSSSYVPSQLIHELLGSPFVLPSIPLVGEEGGEHRYQARPICDRQIAIVDTVTYYIFTLIVS